MRKNYSIWQYFFCEFATCCIVVDALLLFCNGYNVAKVPNL